MRLSLSLLSLSFLWVTSARADGTEEAKFLKSLSDGLIAKACSRASEGSVSFQIAVFDASREAETNVWFLSIAQSMSKDLRLKLARSLLTNDGRGVLASWINVQDKSVSDIVRINALGGMKDIVNELWPISVEKTILGAEDRAWHEALSHFADLRGTDSAKGAWYVDSFIRIAAMSAAQLPPAERSLWFSDLYPKSLRKWQSTALFFASGMLMVGLDYWANRAPVPLEHETFLSYLGNRVGIFPILKLLGLSYIAKSVSEVVLRLSVGTTRLYQVNAQLKIATEGLKYQAIPASLVSNITLESIAYNPDRIIDFAKNGSLIDKNQFGEWELSEISEELAAMLTAPDEKVRLDLLYRTLAYRQIMTEVRHEIKLHRPADSGFIPSTVVSSLDVRLARVNAFIKTLTDPFTSGDSELKILTEVVEREIQQKRDAVRVKNAAALTDAK